MSRDRGRFRDESDDLLREATGMSDEDVERLLGMHGPSRKATPSADELEPGSRVEGVVVEVKGDEVVLELDGKTVGIIDAAEYEDEELPRPGDKLSVELVRYDHAREHAILSAHGVRKEVFWDELRPGAIVEGTVTETNKGGLTLALKGARAFLPVSQIELGRVEDLAPYVGQRLRCEVTQVDRASENLVVSRRRILERDAEEERSAAVLRIQEGEVIAGRVMRLTEHGAFVDLGGVDGLLHVSKIRRELRAEPDQALAVGLTVNVEIVRIDRARGRIALDFHQAPANNWGQALEDYPVGDEVTGWVKAETEAGLVISIEEGIDGLIPVDSLALLTAEALPGDIIKATIAGVDEAGKLLLLRPLPASTKH